MSKYKFKTFDSPEDMYKSYKVAKLLNPKMREEEYKSVIDKITKVSDYKQHVVMQGDEVVSMIATQSVLMMGAVPQLTCKLDNVATLPEHRGYVTSELMQRVKVDVLQKGYGAIHVNCSKDNEKGSKFYKRMGFEDTGKGWVHYLNQANRALER